MARGVTPVQCLGSQGSSTEIRGWERCTMRGGGGGRIGGWQPRVRRLSLMSVGCDSAGGG